MVSSVIQWECEACHSGLLYYVAVSATGKLQFWLSAFSVNGVLAEIFVCVSMRACWLG